jgi:nicotinamide phosphoribosyltransferase
MMMLMSDTYKHTHPRMYPQNLTKLVSYLTPRKNMSPAFDKMVFFGLQPFIREYLIDGFNSQFFDLPLGKVKREYEYYMDCQIGFENTEWEKIEALHKLGYLPIEIRALPEGSVVNMGIPVVEMTNTHPDFAWVVQWIECILQSELWAPCAYATIGKAYHDLAAKYYEETTDGADPFMAMSDFGMRGMSCMDDSIRASASWLLSFNKTSTIPALPYIEDYYYACCKEQGLGRGGVSTEHSVMGANYAIDGDEITFVKRLLTELYPNTSFSMVSDTYDYWNMVNNIIPACKDEILAHNGKLLIRPDSGDMVEISIKTIEKLWDVFGGTVNSKGYKVLDPHIGLIYGDGCTLNRVNEIYDILKQRGFAANNVVFGVGAFCFHALFDDDNKMTVITRDTFGMAMKATYGEFGDKKLFIYKDPKTDDSNLKKSHKGCCRVIRVYGNNVDFDNRIERNAHFECLDQYHGWVPDTATALEPVFLDGEKLQSYDFMDIRRRMYG